MKEENKPAKILCLGNEFIENDKLAKEIAIELQCELPSFEFIFIKDSFQLLNHLQKEKPVVLLDVVENLKKVTVLGIKDLKRRKVLSAHDLDVTFFLDLTKPKKTIIIGIPQTGNKSKIKKDVIKILQPLYP
jgi:Ni,Fe-hydrogenase maturation factor